MREIPVGPHHTAIVDDDDYDDLIQFTWSVLKLSHSRTLYARRTKSWSNGKQKFELMHMRITGFKETDHKNNNGLDNRRSNLRTASRSQNIANTPKLRGTYSSQYKGVSWKRKDSRWIARIMVDQKPISLGSFTDELEASRAYDRAALKYFREFAYTNHPREEYL